MVAGVRGVCGCVRVCVCVWGERGGKRGEKGRKNERRLARSCLGNGERGPR